MAIEYTRTFRKSKRSVLKNITCNNLKHNKDKIKDIIELWLCFYFKKTLYYHKENFPNQFIIDCHFRIKISLTVSKISV